MPPIPSFIMVEAIPYSFGLQQYLHDLTKPKGYRIRVISVHSKILPEDMCLRAENWVFWFTYELISQGFPYKPVLLDAEGFNKIGREIARSVKIYVEDRSIVGYCQILPNGGYGKTERIII
jgi:hypothetical protein